MRLLDDLYSIEQAGDTEAGFDALIAINREHYIYKAHFPGNPITPGVCLIQISKELLELHVSTVLTLSRVVNVKFLSVINPEEHEQITFSFSKIVATEDGYKCATLIKKEEIQFAKLSLIFRRI